MKIKFIIHTGFVGATHEETVEVNEEELGNGTLHEYCVSYLADMINNYIETDYEVLDDD